MGWHADPHKPHAPLTPSVLDPGEAKTSDGRERIFLHIDMDAFFASVETRDNPHLQGLPVVVGGSPGFRGVVTTASYPARKFGLKAGMSAGEAKRLCPEVIFLPVNGRKYTYVSAQIMQALERFSPLVRPLSVDEASVEITGCERLFGSPMALGAQMKNLIISRFRLPCSVGIGPNRLIAKMGANLCKPDGLMEMTRAEAEKAFAPLPVDKMVGIGKATRTALEAIGLYTLGDLANCSDSTLKICFGIVGPALKKMAKGEWAGRMRREDEGEPEEKSMGHQRTFSENISDVKELKSRLVGLAEMVARRVRRAGVVGRVLTLTVRYTDFHTPTHQTKMPCPTDDEETMIEYAWKLFGEIWIPGAPVRLLGLSMSALSPRDEWSGQMDLFKSRSRQRICDLYEAVDGLRDRFGERIVARAMGGRYKEREKRKSSGDIIPFGHLRPSRASPFTTP